MITDILLFLNDISFSMVADNVPTIIHSYFMDIIEPCLKDKELTPPEPIPVWKDPGFPLPTIEPFKKWWLEEPIKSIWDLISNIFYTPATDLATLKTRCFKGTEEEERYKIAILVTILLGVYLGQWINEWLNKCAMEAKQKKIDEANAKAKAEQAWEQKVTLKKKPPQEQQQEQQQQEPVKKKLSAEEEIAAMDEKTREELRRRAYEEFYKKIRPGYRS